MNTVLLHPLLVRLGTTMLHALWEVLLLGLLSWMGLLLLRRQPSTARYAFACSGLVLMVVAPLLTFFWIGSGSETTSSLFLQVQSGALQAAPAGDRSGWRNLLLQTSVMLPWLAILWTMGVSAMVLRLAGGIWWLNRTYLAQAQPLSEPWLAHLRPLAQRMGLKHAVPLLESHVADTPLVIGWFKPVILIPTSALLHLSPEALEAVLAHELAHVLRLDYLANLLQCLAEAILFFHPAAWWLSHQIRELREHCCDDAAAALCGNPMILAEGLSALERLRRSLHSNPEPALAAAKGKLMSRITRLFQPQAAPAPSLRGFITTFVSASLLGAAALTAQQATTAKKAVPSKASKAAMPSLRIAYQPPPPPYPAEARAKTIQGLVVLRMMINSAGLPELVEATEGPKELQAGALAYGKGWRFQPRPQADAGTQAFQLNLLFELKGTPEAAELLSKLPKATGPSATVEIIARAVQASEGLISDFEFSRIKIAHQPKAPDYPAEAKVRGIQGTVVVSITIDEDGNPTAVEALEGPEELRPTAIEYAKGWTFEPAIVNGKPIKARFKLTMPFKLR